MNFRDEQARNLRASLLLTAAFFAVLLGFGLLLDGLFFEFKPIFLSVAVLVAVWLGVDSWYNGARLMVRSTGAKKLNPFASLRHRMVDNIATELAIASGLPKPGLYVEPDDAINAFVAGRSPETAVLCVTEAFIERLDRSEMTAVIGHQLGSIRNGDILTYTILASLVGAFGLMAHWAWEAACEGFSSGWDLWVYALSFLAALAAGILLLASLSGRLVKLFWRQQRAFLSDATSIEFSREPEGLIAALEKIQREGEDTEHGWADMAHAYFVQPRFSPLITQTHPPIYDRIARLRGWMASRPQFHN